MKSARSLLNKVNVGNCYLLAKLHMKGSCISTYPEHVEEFMRSDADLHSCNIIGMVGLLYFWKKLGAKPELPEFPYVNHIFAHPAALKNHVTYRCILYIFDILQEEELIEMTDFLFSRFDEPISLVCLNRVFDIVYNKLKTHSPKAIENFYSHFSKVKNEKLLSLRHKFLLQDMQDIFSNKYKRVYPYMQDIRFLLSIPVQINSGPAEKSKKSGTKFKAFFNTQLRKVILNVVTSSEDPSDCFRRLIDLGLSKKQVSELFLVLMFCACKERPYNDFYFEIFKLFVIRTPKTSKFIRGGIFKLLELKTFVNKQFCNSLVKVITSLNLPELESFPRKAVDGLGNECLEELKLLIKD